jgi:hypothetical protein
LAEVAKRIDRIAHSPTIDLQAAHRKALVARNGQLQHFDPFGRGRQLAITLMGRHGRGKEQDAIQSQLFPAALRQEQVPQVDGVEGSSEQSESHV